MKLHGIAALRLGILASTALISIGQVSAQEVETVTVTGTRIPRPEYDLPNPTMSVTDLDIEHSGATNLLDYLRRIPALTASLGDVATSGINTTQTNAGTSLGGQNLLDLRNLGISRTLVLEDGQRIVPSVTGNSGVDINTIPITLVSRVDVATGGSSAIYGADGVTGVVNFIMKHDLEGVVARIQGGTAESGGASKGLAAVSIGHNFDDGKGNIELTYETSLQDKLNYTQRDFTNVGRATFFVPNPANPNGTDPTLPANIPVTNGNIAGYSGVGAIAFSDNFFNGNGNPDFLGTGQTYVQPGPTLSGEFAIGSNGLPLAAAFIADLIPNQHRHIAQATGDYEFADWFKLTGEFRFAHVDTSSQNEPPIMTDYVITNQNPFLPANVAAAMDTGLLAGAGPGGSSLALLQEFPYQIAGTRLAEKVSRNTYRAVVGASGSLPFLPDFFGSPHYNISYIYGQSNIHDSILNDPASDRLVAALDAVTDPGTGQPTCRSNLNPADAPPNLSAVGFPPFYDFGLQFPASGFGTTFTPGANSGCVPINLFNPNANNKAALKFINYTITTTGFISQNDLNGYVNFSVPSVQNWGSDKELNVVLGGEWRKEVSVSNSPAFAQQAVNPGLFFFPASSPVSGKFQVIEGYAELSDTILADRPWAKELTVDLAGRVSTYDFGGKSSTNETWKIGLVYSPFESVRFRGTDAVAVRAPNIGELFAPSQAGFQSVNDPCDAANLNAGTPFRKANCQALEDAVLGPGVYDANNPAASQVQSATTTPVLVSGNTALQPETARTWTVGVVLQPDFLPNFTFSVDYYRVNITNAIAAPTAQSFADQCVDLSTTANPFCANVDRSAAGNPPGSISQVRSIEINVAQFYTAGVDFTATYNVHLEDWFDEKLGDVSLHLIGNKLDKVATTALPGEDPVDSTNETGSPFWQFNLDAVWSFERWTVDYNWDWNSKVLNTTRLALAGEPNILPPQYIHAGVHDVHSIQIGYDVTDTTNVYFGVENLFYQTPGVGNSYLDVEVGPIGRFFYAGVNYKGEDLVNDLGL